MRRQDYAATLILMLGLAAATLTGFAREAALAQQLGAGRATDIYLIAFTLPEFLFVALPIVLSPAFIPLFAQLRLDRGQAAAWHFGRRVTLAVVLLLLVFLVVAAAGSPLYLDLLAPGFTAADRAEALHAQAVMLPAIVLMGAATLAGAMLQVYRRFARPALATATYNVVFVAALLALPLGWAVGRAAWGVTLGAAAALLIQATLLWRFRPRRSDSAAAGRHDPPQSQDRCSQPVSVAAAPASPAPGLWHLARLVGPLAVGYAVHHLILFVDRAMATTAGAGSVATLNYAYRLALVVGQVSGLAVSTALFPHMAEQAAARDRDGLRDSLAGALRFVWAVGLPASLGLVILRRPLVETLFERGAFDAAATASVSTVLPWYALAVLADALCQPLWRVLYAQRSSWSVVAVNSLQTAVRLAGNFALISLLGYNGLALSAAIGLSVQLLVLGLLARKHVGSFLESNWWRGAWKVILASTGAGLVAQLAISWLPTVPAPVTLLLAGSLAALVYLGIVRFQR